MELNPLPTPLREWAESQNLTEYEWRKPGVITYDVDSDTWRVDQTVLRFVVCSEEEQFYCGLYQGPLEPQPVMYWAAMPRAMAPRSTGVLRNPTGRTDSKEGTAE